MKHKKLLSLAIILLLALPQMLFAQKMPPKLNFKFGDWFETSIRVTNTVNVLDYTFNVRCQVSAKAPNGNLTFKVSVERLKLKNSVGENTWLGYDSYYPPYLENGKKHSIKQTYELIADARGKISKLTSTSSPQKIKLTLISVKTRPSDPIVEFSPDDVLSVDNLKQIFENVMASLASNKQESKTDIQLPNYHNEHYLVHTLVQSASFKLPKNILIKGNITNVTAGDSLYINDELFRFNKDGSFDASISAKANSTVGLLFGKYPNLKILNLILDPSDTLFVKADALDFDKTVSFSGSGAAKAALSKELAVLHNDQWIANENNYYSKSPEEFTSFQKKGRDDFDKLLMRYSNKVPSKILNYYASEYGYVLGATKLNYLYHKKYSAGSQSLRPFEGFPKEFFLSIDTLPVLMNDLEDNSYYQFYLRELVKYRKVKLMMVNGDQYGFFADFATSLASLKGYPLYYSISESFKQELGRSDLESTERLKTYYGDFIRNCGDSSLTNPIKVLWTKARRWLPGSSSPIRKLLLKDGSLFDLTQFKGKPLVLIANYDDPNILEGYIDVIKRQKGSEVHFVVAQLNVPALDKSRIHQTLKTLPNVTYVELSGDADKQQNFDINFMETKVFTFDSDFRVIFSYLFDKTSGYDKIIPDLIKKTVDSNNMTAEQKASLINTIGWSICSILFTSVVIFAVYRARLSGIKKKNNLKNQIRELEIKAIRSQMNPHFLFNSMNSIQSLINNKQYLQANIYLEKFSLLMRTVLNNSETSFVTLSDELDAITLYCELEQLRFDFKFEMEVAQGVNIRLMEIPGMIIQPLVENSILHGLAQKGEAGRLAIQISLDEGFLKIVVKDNGTGLKENIKEGHQSFGLKLVRERLALLNTGETVGNLHLSSNLGENESGVTAILTIPID